MPQELSSSSNSLTDTRANVTNASASFANINSQMNGVELVRTSGTALNTLGFNGVATTAGGVANGQTTGFTRDGKSLFD
jgi:hypothetical protein